MRIDWRVVGAIASRTFRNAVESPIAYVAGIFFYSLVGSLFALNYFSQGQASIEGVVSIAPWGLWFVIPVLTMGLFSDEMRSGTYESLATLPVSDTEIVLGKFLGFAAVSFFLILGLAFFVVVAVIIAIMICTVFFLAGQFYTLLPGWSARLADFIGIGSHMGTLSRGVWDIRDLFYFVSLPGFFLFLTVQRLTTRRF